MAEVLEIKAKYSKGDRLFMLKEGAEGASLCLIPVIISHVDSIKFYSQANNIITYGATTVDKNIGIRVNEINLYSAEEIARFLK